jgi:hypothetical protein
MYGYNVAGSLTKKRVRVSTDIGGGSVDGDSTEGER